LEIVADSFTYKILEDKAMKWAMWITSLNSRAIPLAGSSSRKKEAKNEECKTKWFFALLMEVGTKATED